MQLVQRYPEMPSELELDDNRRKQLAELLLEYPTKKDEDEQENPPRENKQKRNDITHARNAKKSTAPCAAN